MKTVQLNLTTLELEVLLMSVNPDVYILPALQDAAESAKEKMEVAKQAVIEPHHVTNPID